MGLEIDPHINFQDLSSLGLSYPTCYIVFKVIFRNDTVTFSVQYFPVGYVVKI